MGILLQVAGIAAFIGFFLWLAWWQRAKTRANLQAMAQRLGLELREKKSFGMVTDFELVGAAADRPLRFWTYSTGSGKSRRTWVAVSVRPQPRGDLTFELRRQGLATKFMAWFGRKGMAVGDPEFDAVWRVQSNRPEFFAAALVPEIRAKLMGAGPGIFSLELADVRYAEQGTFASPKQCARLEQQVALLQDLADLTEVAAAQPIQGAARMR